MKRFFVAVLVLVICCGLGAAEEKVKPDELIGYKNVKHEERGEEDLELHVFWPAGHKRSDERACIVFFFGGGWNGGSPGQFYAQSEYFASRGMVAISAQYRTMKSHGVQPSVCVQDGKSAIRWVRQHAEELGIDPDRIAAGGGSAGGHVAAATGTLDGFEEEGEDQAISSRPNALVLFNPVYDNGPNGYGHDRVEEYWEEFSPMHNIDERTPATIVFFGTEDDLVSPATAKKYKRRMKKNGVRSELFLYKGQGHGFFNSSKNDGEYFRKTVLEADKFLASLGYLEGEPTIKDQ